jgi:hypothetical protein
MNVTVWGCDILPRTGVGAGVETHLYTTYRGQTGRSFSTQLRSIKGTGPTRHSKLPPASSSSPTSFSQPTNTAVNKILSIISLVETAIPQSAQRDPSAACFLIRSYAPYYSTPSWYMALPTAAQSYLLSVNAENTAACSSLGAVTGAAFGFIPTTAADAGTTTSSNNSGGLGSGAKIGIVAGTVVTGAAIFGALLYWLLRRRVVEQARAARQFRMGDGNKEKAAVMHGTWPRLKVSNDLQMNEVLVPPTRCKSASRELPSSVTPRAEPGLTLVTSEGRHVGTPAIESGIHTSLEFLVKPTGSSIPHKELNGNKTYTPTSPISARVSQESTLYSMPGSRSDSIKGDLSIGTSNAGFAQQPEEYNPRDSFVSSAPPSPMSSPEEYDPLGQNPTWERVAENAPELSLTPMFGSTDFSRFSGFNFDIDATVLDNSSVSESEKTA